MQSDGKFSGPVPATTGAVRQSISIFKDGGVDKLGEVLIQAAKLKKSAVASTLDQKKTFYAIRPYGGETGQARRKNILSCMPYILACQNIELRKKAIVLLSYALLDTNSQSFTQLFVREVCSSWDTIFLDKLLTLDKFLLKTKLLQELINLNLAHKQELDQQTSKVVEKLKNYLENNTTNTGEIVTILGIRIVGNQSIIANPALLTECVILTANEQKRSFKKRDGRSESGNVGSKNEVQVVFVL